jgi:hypothetical protein
MTIPIEKYDFVQYVKLFFICIEPYPLDKNYPSTVKLLALCHTLLGLILNRKIRCSKEMAAPITQSKAN